METIICKKCEAILPATDEFFYRTGKSRKLCKTCKDCYPSGAQSQRQRRAEGRLTEKDKQSYAEMRSRVDANLERLTAIKLERGCADCGYNLYSCALDFDHLPGTKKEINLSYAVLRSWEKIEAELAKCEVVCANCHRVRTQNRKRKAGAPEETPAFPG